MLYTSSKDIRARPGASFTRTLGVSLDLLFKAWTSERILAAWWGPYGFTSPVCCWEAKPGGKIYIDMTSSDGMVFPMKGIFHEVIPSAKLVFTTQAFEDETRQPQLEVLNTVTFFGDAMQAAFVLQADVKKATPEVRASLEGMQQGWEQGLDKLEELLNEINRL